MEKHLPELLFGELEVLAVRADTRRDIREETLDEIDQLSFYVFAAQT
jgi:hypothetical protein